MPIKEIIAEVKRKANNSAVTSPDSNEPLPPRKLRRRTPGMIKLESSAFILFFAGSGHLRAEESIAAIESFSWWSATRMAGTMGAVVVVALLTVGWALFLRQRNQLLRSSLLELKEANNQLEARVKQRTGDLERAREELARKHARLEFVFESVPMGIAFTKVAADSTLSRRVNPVPWVICGIDRQGHADFDFFEATYEEDRPHQIELHGRLDRGEVDGYSLDKRYVRPDGELVWVRFSVQRRKFEEGGYEDLSTIVDITALKRSQEEAAYERDLLRTLLDHAPDFIYFKDLQSRFIKSSKSQANCVGVESPEEMVGKTDFDFFCEAHAKQAFADEQKVIRTGEPLIGQVEHSSYRKQGGQFWVTATKMPFRDKKGEIIGIFGISRDISSLKRAEAELEGTHRRLLEVSRQAGMAEVATNVLHNVGNVLNSVNVSATVVDEQVRRSKSASVERVSSLLKENASRLGTFLTEDPQGRKVPAFLHALAVQLAVEKEDTLRELKSLRSKIDHIKEIVAMQQNYAKISGVVEACSVVELVEDALSINADSFVRSGFTVERDFRSSPSITAERHKILQILVNLMQNAKEACLVSEKTEKQVTVRVSEERGRIAIAIQDNGVGIAPENLSRIFGHGFTTRTDGHGFGLHSGALAACESGGSLRAESDGPHKGATFILDLPKKPEEQTAEAPAVRN